MRPKLGTKQSLLSRNPHHPPKSLSESPVRIAWISAKSMRADACSEIKLRNNGTLQNDRQAVDAEPPNYRSVTSLLDSSSRSSGDRGKCCARISPQRSMALQNASQAFPD